MINFVLLVYTVVFCMVWLVHKQLINNFPPFRSILSAIDAPSYNTSKFLVPFLKPQTTNDSRLKDTFNFSRDILNQNPNLLMANLDVDSSLH